MRRKTVLVVIFTVLITCTFDISLSAEASQEIPGSGLRVMGLEKCEPGSYAQSEYRYAGAAGLPSSHELTLDKLPVGDQGRQGSCAGWAVGYYYKTYQEEAQHGWDVSKADKRFSPSWLYNQANRGSDNGTTFPRVFEVLKSSGIVDINEFPYIDSDYLKQPDSNQKEAAKPYMISEYAAIWTSPGNNNINAIKSHLVSGDPVVLGIPVYDNFYYCSNGWVGTPGSGSCHGGHAVCVVGYSDSAGGGQGGFKIANSWGTGWGNSGYAYLSYDFVRDYVWEAWIMTDSPSDTPNIESVSPQNGSPGTKVLIKGDDFGTSRGSSKVTFSGATARIDSWNNNVIKAVVPGSAADGNVSVFNWAGERSNGAPFDVGMGISSIAPGTVEPGGTVTAYGTEFKDSPGELKMGDEALEIISWSASKIQFKAPDELGSGKITVVNGEKTTSSTELRVANTVLYLAEGCTGNGFEEWICIQNPQNKTNTVEITYMTPEGPVQRPPLTLSPGSRSTVAVGADLPGSDVSTLLVSDGEILAERAMYWNGRLDGHASEGVNEPRTEWFLAEGYTGPGFDTWVLVQNASSEPAQVDVTYYTPEGPVEKAPLTIPASSRASIHANDDVPGKDISIGIKASRPVVVERSMYWDGMRGGHNSCATPEPATEWYLAEGSTMYGFDEWVTIGNPSADTASVEVDYITTGGTEQTVGVSVPPQSRRTVHVNEDIQVGEVSVVVRSDRPVVVERSMYWNNGTGRAGHGALGATHPSLTHFLAEGCTANGFDQWVLIENPSKKDTTSVVLTYMTPNGLVSGPTINIQPMRRHSVHVNLDVPTSDVSVKVEATSPVIVERAMYWAGRGGGHNAMAVGVD